MGTTSIFLRFNDLKKPLSGMSKKELKLIDSFSPYGPEQCLAGWSAPLELHNGNIYALVFWKGRLMKLADAPKTLKEKYYDRYKGKTLKEYEWTVLKRFLSAEIKRLDKEFKKLQRKNTAKTAENEMERQLIAKSRDVFDNFEKQRKPAVDFDMVVKNPGKKSK